MADFRIGSTFGFEIRIDYSWFILFFLILWSFSSSVFPGMLPGLTGASYLLMGAMGTVLFFASLLIHELAHALVARAHGIPVLGITLFIFGGVARTARESARPGEEFQVAGAGPLMSFLLAALFYAIGTLGVEMGLQPALVAVAGFMALLNVALAVFNLLPGFPLDGGRLLRAGLWKITGDLTRATRWSSFAGQGLAWCLIAVGAFQIVRGYTFDGLWLILIAWFLRDAAIRSYKVHLIVKHHDRAQATLRRLIDVRENEGGFGADAGGGATADPFVIPAERLPAGFADSVESPTTTPAEPRPAATIVLMRDGAAGPEALLLKRHRSSGFVPGAYVFAGGRVDAGDADPLLRERAPDLRSPLEPDAAYWFAAVREAFEETGVLMGRAQRASELAAAREQLMADQATLCDVLERADATLDLSGMVYIAHWITPLAEPRRYDTRFFLAALPAGAQVAIDEREMTDARWFTPGHALREFEAGRLPMVFPTVKTLAELSDYGSVAEAVDALRGQPVTPILPRLVRRPDGVGIRIDDDDAASRR